ncbi:MAG: hypothetical protein V4507_00325 [Verrucomicrobiota bacterium]
MKKQLTRYLVEFPTTPIPVGYNASLGKKDARSWAIHTACRFFGRITEEYSDGTMEVTHDYSKNFRESN